MPDEDHDPKFCAFCEEDHAPEDARPSEGRMLLVFQGTQTEIPGATDPPSPLLRCCNDCGQRYTDALFGENDKGEVAVFQFEHDAYSEVTEEQHATLFEQLETNKCSLCDEVLWPDENQEQMPTKVLVEKLLRQAPDGVSLSLVCGRCTDEGRCPDCNEDHDHAPV